MVIQSTMVAAAPSDDFISQNAFERWVVMSHQQARLLEFDDYLRTSRVGDILPDYQILRTSSSWRRCGTDPFEIPPKELWPNISNSLKFIRDHVVMAIGPIEAVSGFRNDRLNSCSGGKPKSAHREYFALDLLPSKPITRATLIKTLCKIHGAAGSHYRAGLGFYNGVRFHIDGRSYRRWGSDGQGHTSPCNSKFN